MSGSAAGLHGLVAAVAVVVASGVIAHAEAPAAPADITVYGKVLGDAPHLVERFSRTMGDERLARWRTPVCVKVQGLSPEHNAWVEARIRDIAEEAQAPVEDRACEPDLIVVVAADDLAVRVAIARRGVAFISAGSIDRSQLTTFAARDGAPAHIFYARGTVAAGAGGTLLHTGSSDTTQFGFGSLLGPPVIKATASRLTPSSERAFKRVFVVLDGARLPGRSLNQVAAYAAMISLAEVKIDDPLREPQSVTAMFADVKDGLPPAPDLTLWDRAYLRALYGVDSQINLSMQQSYLADALKKVVQRATAAGPVH